MPLLPVYTAAWANKGLHLYEGLRNDVNDCINVFALILKLKYL